MSIVIDLGDLSAVSHAVTDHVAGTMREACIINMDHHRHQSGVELRVVNDTAEELFVVSWSDPITEEMRNYFQDRDYNTDHAACAISLMIIPKITDYSTLRKSRKGNGYDFVLIAADPRLIFNGSAYLEVSGILEENKGNTVDARIEDKRKRLLTMEGSPISQGQDATVYICVVEFSRPWSKLVRV